MPTAAHANENGWTVVESPTGNRLYDVEYTIADSYAAGAGGFVLERTRMGWRKVLDGGPTWNGNSLYGADVTDDGDGLTVGGGKAFDLTDGRWKQEATPTGENLKAVVRGSPDITVGAGGTIVEY